MKSAFCCLAALYAYFAVSCEAAPYKAVQTLRADVTGDGQLETIRLEQKTDDESAYRLSVAGVTGAPVAGKLEGVADNLIVLDLHAARRGREIVVQAVLPGRYEYAIYRLDGRRLRSLGVLGGEEASIDAPGNGTIVQTRLVDAFWECTQTLVWRGDRFVLVPQSLYPVQVSARVRTALPLYKSRADKRPLRSLRAGERVRLLQSDLNGWFLVLAPNGSRLWTRSGEILSRLDGLPVRG